MAAQTARKLKILGTGKYLPQRIVKSSELDSKLGLKAGTLAELSGVEERRYIDQETNSEMAAKAVLEALAAAQMTFKDLDLLIYASGTQEQAIPCTGALVQKALDEEKSGIPCFDINSTCLSFVTALDMAASLIDSNRYRSIAIVSSEIASVGLNFKQLEACALFGDGAAAIIVGLPREGEGSRITSALMKTYSKGARYCEIRGGGTKLHPRDLPVTEENIDNFLFHMDGRKVFKMALENISSFTEELLKQANEKNISDFEMVIPHQASASGMELIRRKLNISKDRYMNILGNHGNMIAASIPLALHYAIENKQIKRGDKVIMMGTSAGLSIGGIALEY